MEGKELALAIADVALEKQAQALAAIADRETLSKKETMALTGVCETHLSRYLQTGVILAWKVPQGPQGRGFWRVDRASAERFVQLKKAGQLQALLDATPAYVALRQKNHAEIVALREAGRLACPEPLLEPKSKYHPGCFTVAQVAKHTGLKTKTVYDAIKDGSLKAVRIMKGGRFRYAVRPDEARCFAKKVLSFKS